MFPYELFNLIFQFSDIQTMNVLKLTSKSFYNIFHEKKNFKIRCDKKINNMIQKKNINKCLKWSISVENIYIFKKLIRLYNILYIDKYLLEAVKKSYINIIIFIILTENRKKLGINNNICSNLIKNIIINLNKKVIIGNYNNKDIEIINLLKDQFNKLILKYDETYYYQNCYVCKKVHRFKNKY